jgi:SnoaL-like protein
MRATTRQNPSGPSTTPDGHCVAMADMGDIEDIQRVKYRYLRALDTKHWDEFADTLTEDVIGDYGESLGEGHHFTDRATLVEFMRNSMPAEVITEHRVTHPEIDVDGDEATGIWYLQDKVIVPKFDFMLIGAAFYHDRYRRTADGWRISATGYDRTYDASLSTKELDFKVKAGRAVQI